MIRRMAIFVCGALCFAPRAASAQGSSWGDRLFVNVNIGSQPASRDDAARFGFTLFNETGTVDVARTVKGGPFFDVTAGTILHRPFGLAMNFMRRSADSDGTLSASIPDPRFYDEPQEFSGAVAALEHRETWFAGLLVYQLPSIGKADVMILGGPAVVHDEHEVVTDVSVDSGGGQVSASLAKLSRNFFGFQVGADVRYLVARHVGLGGYARFSSAKGNLGPEIEADLGGFQFGAGLRLRF